MRGVRVIVMGASAGGMEAYTYLFSRLPKTLRIPIAVVQHSNRNGPSRLAEVLSVESALKVVEVVDKDPLVPGQIHLAPPNYHLLLEADGTLSLSVEEQVQHSRPSIDVLFESAAYAYGVGAFGVLLTGANADGALGLFQIQQAGGFTFVQDPETAAFPTMPQAALALSRPSAVGSLDHLLNILTELAT